MSDTSKTEKSNDQNLYSERDIVKAVDFLEIKNKEEQQALKEYLNKIKVFGYSFDGKNDIHLFFPNKDYSESMLLNAAKEICYTENKKMKGIVFLISKLTGISPKEIKRKLNTSVS